MQMLQILVYFSARLVLARRVSRISEIVLSAAKIIGQRSVRNGLPTVKIIFKLKNDQHFAKVNRSPPFN